MTSPRYNGPASKRDSAAIQASAGGGSLGGLVGHTANLDLGGAGGYSSDRLYRPSLDNMGGASESRRPSANSIQSSHASHTSQHSAASPNLVSQPLSPSSVSSSSTHPWMTPSDMTGQLSSSPQAAMAQLPQHQPLPSAIDRPPKHLNLPRISTPTHRDARPPNNSDDFDDGGPRSAPPISSPLAGPAMPFSAGPLRSASDPSRTGEQGSGRSSPMTSPVSPDPHSAHFKSRSQDGAGLPPRVSSFTNTAAAMDSHVGRRSDTPTSTNSSQAAVPLQIQQPSSTGLTPKRSGSTTYCAKCGQTVHGQFVRALHQVYHLDCFRCKVSNAVERLVADHVRRTVTRLSPKSSSQ